MEIQVSPWKARRVFFGLCPCMLEKLFSAGRTQGRERAFPTAPTGTKKKQPVLHSMVEGDMPQDLNPEPVQISHGEGLGRRVVCYGTEGSVGLRVWRTSVGGSRGLGYIYRLLHLSHSYILNLQHTHTYNYHLCSEQNTSRHFTTPADKQDKASMKTLPG